MSFCGFFSLSVKIRTTAESGVQQRQTSALQSPPCSACNSQNDNWMFDNLVQISVAVAENFLKD